MNNPYMMVQKALEDGKLSGSWLITGADVNAREEFVKSVLELILKQSFHNLMVFHPCVKRIECDLTEEAKKDIQKSILSGKSVDDKAEYAHKREITVDDVREGLKFLSLSAAENEWRILIVNPADKMNQAAANAFLKMLEEPPKNALILLLVDNRGRLLSTIRSRCRKIVLHFPPQKELANKIKKCYPTVIDADKVAEISGGSFDMASLICEHDGLEIYQKVVAFFAPLEQVSVKELKDFVAALSDEKIKLVKKFILNELTNRAKKYALLNPFYTEDLIEVYQTITQLFIDVDRIYLDKKQVLETAFRKISEVVHD